MKQYLSGQILESCRGDGQLGVVVAQNGEKEKFSCFIYPIVSEEYVHLTGVRSVNNPLKRVYQGVDHETASKIAINVDSEINQGKMNFKDLDREIIIPYFLSHKH